MATPQFLDYLTRDQQVFPGAPNADVQMGILACLSAIASGMNPDGTTSPAGEGTDSIQPANILQGRLGATTNQVAVTLLTIPAGRIWVGQLTIGCAASDNAATTTIASSICTIAVAGAGSIPAAGTIFSLGALSGGNTATGLTASSASNAATISVVVAASTAGPVTITGTITVAGDNSRGDLTAYGLLQ
jgi:hypothetical protein